jgi:hypothetical protein
MREVREGEPETWFPEYGARARRWRRFEDDLRAWLDSPEGRFAAWRARSALAGAPEEGRQA